MKISKENREAILIFVQQLDAAKEALEDALEDYNRIVEEADELIRGIAEDLRDEFNDKSESWQESLTGMEAEVFVQEWEEADFSQSLSLDLHHPSTLGELRTESE